MPPSWSQVHKTKRGSTGGTAKSAPKTQAAQTDVKGFFQYPQMPGHQEASNIPDLNVSSSTGEAELDTSGSSTPLGMQKATTGARITEGGHWDMQACIQSLPTREDMGKYVLRLETSYKAELKLMKTSLVDTQNKMDTVEARVALIDQKCMESETKNQEQDQCLKFAIITIDDQENRIRQNNIRVRGMPEATGLEDSIPIL